jgi:hypothetical protein
MGDWVVARTNGEAPTSTPMSVVAVSQADLSKVLNLELFASSNSKNSLIPSMVSVDPAASQIYVMERLGEQFLDREHQTGRPTAPRELVRDAVPLAHDATRTSSSTRANACAKAVEKPHHECAQ